MTRLGPPGGQGWGAENRVYTAYVRWIRAFAESLPAPVLATPKDKGTLADPHPPALGAPAAGHPALARADLVILVSRRACLLVVVALGALDPASAARLHDTGVPPLACRDESGFAGAFSRAWQTARPTVLAADPGRAR